MSWRGPFLAIWINNQTNKLLKVAKSQSFTRSIFEALQSFLKLILAQKDCLLEGGDCFSIMPVMGKLRVKRRQHQIRAKQTRKVKLAKLREEFQSAKNGEAKKKILDKVFKISPWTTEEKFLASLKKAKQKSAGEIQEKTA